RSRADCGKAFADREEPTARTGFELRSSSFEPRPKLEARRSKLGLHERRNSSQSLLRTWMPTRYMVQIAGGRGTPAPPADPKAVLLLAADLNRRYSSRPRTIAKHRRRDRSPGRRNHQ